MRHVDPRFGPHLRRLIEQQHLSYRTLAARTHYSRGYLHDLATGRKHPTEDTAQRLDDALHAAGTLAAMVTPAPAGDEQEAADLAARVAASDISTDTLDQMQATFDRLAMGYATTPPALLLPDLRRHLNNVRRLVDARATLAQQRRLLVIGGWLSLLAATVHIDMRQTDAAHARLATAGQLADHTGHDEIRAWCLETRAWEILTAGDYAGAVALSRQAQAMAPPGSSVHIQATAQEGRAWARMRARAETRDALARVTRLVAGLPQPEQPEHHYRYDPGKADSYAATTLAWAGDPAAEEYARSVITGLEAGCARPRRVASARLDLALALVAADKPDEAAAVATAAIVSGRVVASNWWRAVEVMSAVERSGIREAAQMREAYETHRP